MFSPYSLCGYSNAISFKNITNTDYDFITKFVLNELSLRLAERCQRNNVVMSSHEKELFFGMYADSTDEFKLQRGDLLLIFDIVNGLNEIYASKGPEEFAKYFTAPKKYKISKVDTNVFTFGTFFGQKDLHFSKMHLSTEDLATQFFSKLKTFFSTFEELKMYRSITEDIFKIIDLGSGFRADVICVFCSSNDCDIDALLKKYCVQQDKSGSWNFSNLRKHMNQHIKSSSNTENREFIDINEIQNVSSGKKIVNSSLVQIEKEDDSLQFDINEWPIIFDENKEHSIVPNQNIDLNNKQLNKIMYDQFASQNLLLCKSALTKPETKKNMVVNIDNRFMDIDVIKMKGDGNCLFHTLAHQLDCTDKPLNHKILRKEIVDYLKLNVTKYELAITSHHEYKGEKNTEGCVKLLCEKLSQSGVWGGIESLLAASQIYRVNILIFNEKGPFYFATGFNVQYDRCIFMAYRIGSIDDVGKPKYQHYDSPAGISEEILYKCASQLSEKMQND